MNRVLRRIGACAAVIALLLISAPAFAGDWSTPGGATASFTYSNGGDINGLFGEPYVDAGSDTFFFVGSNFQANASDGATVGQNDTMSVDIQANPMLQFSSMTITAFGDYAVTGVGSSVDFDSMLGMTELGGLGRSFVDELETVPAFPLTSGSGSWDGWATVDVTFVFPVPHDHINISLTNDLLAISAPGGGAQVNVQYEDLAISFVMIPEPATLSLLAVGTLALIRRRR